MKRKRRRLKNGLVSQKTSYKIIVLFITGVFLFLLFNSFQKSLFFQKPDRLNVLFYGPKTRYISFGLEDKINYYINFFPDLEIEVPGGYGWYRVGGIGKLAQLEKNDKIFQRAFSLNTASFTHFYFYPKKTVIYYGNKKNNQFIKPSIGEIFSFNSNANIFDRIYIFLLVSKFNANDYRALKINLAKRRGEDKILTKQSLKRLEGFFYQTTYRKERKSVQIIYTKEYKNPLFISYILEGEGIKVVDISQAEKKKGDSSCVVIEGGEVFSDTAYGLANFFNCRLKRGKTQISDIILALGRLEEDWEIK